MTDHQTPSVSPIEDGGPAYPTKRYELIGSRKLRSGEIALTSAEVEHPGMSLRDWFAGQALPAVMAQLASISNEEFLGMASRRGLTGDRSRMAHLASAMAYEIAAALLSARKGGAA